LPRSACCEEAVPRDYRDDRVKGVLLVVSGRDQSGADAGVKADLLVDGAVIGLEGGGMPRAPSRPRDGAEATEAEREARKSLTTGTRPRPGSVRRRHRSPGNTAASRNG
jgi:hypothetical protein